MKQKLLFFALLLCLTLHTTNTNAAETFRTPSELALVTEIQQLTERIDTLNTRIICASKKERKILYRTGERLLSERFQAIEKLIDATLSSK